MGMRKQREHDFGYQDRISKRIIVINSNGTNARRICSNQLTEKCTNDYNIS
jgi:hypothetical protein